MDFCNFHESRDLSTDGTCITGKSVKKICITDDRLRCVDLVQNEKLEIIDLTLCKTPIHLMVKDCPRLRQVILPEQSLGAILHFDFGDGADIIEISGAIAQIDICQNDGLIAQTFISDLHYSGALIFPKGAIGSVSSMHFPQDIQVFIGLSPLEGQILKYLENHSAIRCVVLAGEPNVKKIELQSSRIEAATFTRCKVLESIKIHNDLQVLSIDRCQKICAVHGVGQKLVVTEAKTDQIELRGGWERAQFKNVMSHLPLAIIGEIESYGCRYIKPSNLNFANSTNPLAILPDPECIFDPEWQDLLLCWVKITQTTETILPALRLLSALVKSGLDPAIAMQARKQLHRHMIKDKFVSNTDPWFWPANDDLAFEAHDQDAQFWLDCADQNACLPLALCDPATISNILSISAFLRIAKEASDEVRTHILTRLQIAFSDIKKPSIYTKWQKILPHQSNQTKLIGCSRIIDAFVQLKQYNAAIPLLRQLPDLITIFLPEPEHSLRPLSVLSHLGLVEARAVLLIKSRQTIRDNSELAAKFHAAAFQPVKYPVFDF